MRILPLGLVLAVALGVAGCGSSSSSSSSSSASSSSTTTSSSTAPAAAGHVVAIAGVASKAGAAKPGPDTLKQLKKVGRGSTRAHLGGLGKLPLSQAVQVVSNDINKFWSGEFANSNVQWPAVQDVIVDSSTVSTGCSRSTVAPTDPWLLCDSQSGATFYWTIPWMQQNIATDQGGVNLAFSMAELWSLHILNLVGATTQVQSGQLSKGAYAQTAVCLAGVYIYTLNQRKLFEQGDQQSVTNFVNALNSVGGIGSPDVTAQQLQQAFSAGAQSGNPSTCGLGSGGGGGGQSSTSTTTSATTTTTTSGGGGGSTTPLGSNG